MFTRIYICLTFFSFIFFVCHSFSFTFFFLTWCRILCGRYFVFFVFTATYIVCTSLTLAHVCVPGVPLPNKMCAVRGMLFSLLILDSVFHAHATTNKKKEQKQKIKCPSSSCICGNTMCPLRELFFCQKIYQKSPPILPPYIWFFFFSHSTSYSSYSFPLLNSFFSVVIKYFGFFCFFFEFLYILCFIMNNSFVIQHWEDMKQIFGCLFIIFWLAVSTL